MKNLVDSFILLYDAVCQKVCFICLCEIKNNGRKNVVYDLSINENRGIIIIIDVLPQENYLWHYFFRKSDIR